MKKFPYEAFIAFKKWNSSDKNTNNDSWKSKVSSVSVVSSFNYGSINNKNHLCFSGKANFGNNTNNLVDNNNIRK